MDSLGQIRKKFKKLGSKDKAAKIKKYLKSSYDFYGVSVPDVRSISKELRNLEFQSALDLSDKLWYSKRHEEMLLALFVLVFHVKQYPSEVWKFMVDRLEKANTWGLTDEISAHILGPILTENLSLKNEIIKLSESKNPWLRRTGIVATISLIRSNKIELALKLAEKLVYDEDIYVQKGAGWMLREAGIRNKPVIKKFILAHADMKPAAFSYATEKMLELRKKKKANKIKL